MMCGPGVCRRGWKELRGLKPGEWMCLKVYRSVFWNQVGVVVVVFLFWFSVMERQCLKIHRAGLVLLLFFVCCCCFKPCSFLWWSQCLKVHRYVFWNMQFFCDGVTVFKGTSVCVLKSCSFLWWSDSVYRYIGMCFENVWIFVISSQFLKVHRSVF